MSLRNPKPTAVAVGFSLRRRAVQLNLRHAELHLGFLLSGA
jgi:hypothetical protein